MKKFHYRKGDDLDYTKPTVKRPARDFDAVRDELIKSFKTTTPIILRLDRLQTVNVNKDGLKVEVGRSRATSISSLEQFKDHRTLPRVRAREFTKSLSEDVFSNSNYPNTVVITETDLSSSWLYKNMKAVVNLKDGNENQTGNSSRSLTPDPDLSPVMLQDPKMKPVPVQTKSRKEKTSSRCCYVAIMMVISICSLGFMSTIGGIIYLEAFSNRSVAINPTGETPLDALGLLDEIQSKLNNDEMERNHEDVNDHVKESASSNSESENLNQSVSVNEDKELRTVHILDFGKPLATDLTQYIDNTRTQIRMHEDKGVIYEEKSSSSVEYQGTSNVRNIEGNRNKTGNGSNQSENIRVTAVKSEELDKLEGFLSTRFDRKDSTSNDNPPNLRESQKSDHVVLDSEKLETIIEKVPNAISEESLNEDPTKQRKLTAAGEDSSLRINDWQLGNIKKDIEHEISPDHMKQEDGEMSENVKESSKVSLGGNNEKSITGSRETIFSSDEYKSGESELDESDIGYETMITAINEHIQEVSKQELEMNRFSDRNDDSYTPAGEDSNFRTEEPARVEIEFKRPRLPATNFHRVQEVPFEPEPKKQVDIKVSLAEAMKRLQVLDVQNKIPSARTKSAKPKVKNTRPLSRISVEQKAKELEQKQYLENLRLLFYNGMQ